MTTLLKVDPLKLREINGKLALAKSNLKMANSLLVKEEFIRGATDLGYNAAELCARGLILLKQDDLPSRHRGIVQKFSELYVKDGPLEKDVGRRLNKGLDYRNNARYVPDAEITKEHAVHNTELAEKLIKFLEKELKTRNIQKSNSGLGLIGVLIIIGALILTAGGVVVWQKRISPRPTPIPTPLPQVLPTPTVGPSWIQSCQTDNDCPKQFCQPAGTPCPQYYCIQGKCQLVEPEATKPASLEKEIKLTPGQTAEIEGTNLSISLLKITPPPEGSFDYPTKAELEIRSGGRSEKIYFIAGVLATEEVAEELRHKEVFGFRITRKMLNSEQIILTVQKL